MHEMSHAMRRVVPMLILFAAAIIVCGPSVPLTPASAEARSSGAAAFAANAPDAVPPGAIADWLRQSNVLVHRDFDTAFTIKAPAARAASDEGPWDFSEANLDLHMSFRYVALGDRFHVTRRTPPPDVRYEQINVWANGEWTHRVIGDRGVTFGGRAGPADLWSQGFIFNVMEGRYPCPLHTLAHNVEHGSTLAQSMEGGVLTHRFAAAGVPNDQTQFELRIEAEPPHRLLEYTVTGYSLDPGTNRPVEPVIASQTYSVAKWREIEPGVWIPEVADIHGGGHESPNPDVGSPYATRVRYERSTFHLIEDPSGVDPALFETPLPPGTGVYDNRTKLSFRIGDTHLKVGDMAYELPEPITEHPHDKLADLIRSAIRKQPSRDCEAPPKR